MIVINYLVIISLLNFLVKINAENLDEEWQENVHLKYQKNYRNECNKQGCAGLQALNANGTCKSTGLMTGGSVSLKLGEDQKQQTDNCMFGNNLQVECLHGVPMIAYMLWFSSNGDGPRGKRLEVFTRSDH